MGLNEPAARATYLSLQDGKLALRLKSMDDHPSAVKREHKYGTVYERYFDSIDGNIVDIQIRSGTYNGETIEKDKWYVTIMDGSDRFVITIPYSSGYSKSFLNALCGVEDLSQRLRIRPWMMEDEKEKGKFWRGITIYSAPYAKENKVPKTFEKDDIPAAEQKRVKGKDIWDDEVQMLWWEDKVANIIMPRIEAARSVNAFNAIGASDDDHGQAEPAGSSDEFDDVPF